MFEDFGGGAVAKKIAGYHQFHAVNVELLRKLLSGEIQTRRKKNVVQAKSFAAMLEEAIRKYQNRAIEAAQVIE